MSRSRHVETAHVTGRVRFFGAMGSRRPLRASSFRLRGTLLVLSMGAILAVALGFSGCSNRLSMAVGMNHDVGLITAFDGNDPRVSRIAGLLQEPVETVRTERRFIVHLITPDLFASNRSWKSLVVLVDLNRPGALQRQVRMLLSDAELSRLREERTGYRVVRDVWARGQTVLLVHATDPAAFQAWIAEQGRALVEAYEEGIQISLEPIVLAQGEQTEMTRYLQGKYGFRVRVPKEYVIAEDPDGRVVRLYRIVDGEPPRFLLLHWLPAAEAPSTPEAMLELRDRLAREYYDGDRVMMARAGTEETLFQKQPAVLLRGVWQNEKYTIGGPFRSYAFIRGDRFFLLDASVYNPPGDKLPYLREVLALARTFRTTEAL